MYIELYVCVYTGDGSFFFIHGDTYRFHNIDHIVCQLSAGFLSVFVQFARGVFSVSVGSSIRKMTIQCRFFHLEGTCTAGFFWCGMGMGGLRRRVAVKISRRGLELWWQCVWLGGGFFGRGGGKKGMSIE